MTEEIKSSIFPELTQEKSLWDIAVSAKKIGLPRFSIISTFMVGSLLTLYAATTEASIAELKAIVVELTKLTLELSVNLLGLFLAAFSVFTAVGKTEMLVTMAKIPHKESGLNYLKYNFISFVMVFVYFLGFALVSYVIYVGFSLRRFALNDAIGDQHAYAFESSIVRIGLIIVGAGFFFVLFQLKSLLYNLYHSVMTSLRWIAEGHSS